MMAGYEGPVFGKRESKNFKKNPIFQKESLIQRETHTRDSYETALNSGKKPLKLPHTIDEDASPSLRDNYPIPYLKNRPSHDFTKAQVHMTYEPPIETYDKTKASTYEPSILKNPSVIEPQDTRSKSKTRLYAHADQNLHHLVKRLVKTNDTFLLFE